MKGAAASVVAPAAEYMVTFASPVDADVFVTTPPVPGRPSSSFSFR